MSHARLIGLAPAAFISLLIAGCGGSSGGTAQPLQSKVAAHTYYSVYRTAGGGSALDAGLLTLIVKDDKARLIFDQLSGYAVEYDGPISGDEASLTVNDTSPSTSTSGGTGFQTTLSLIFSQNAANKQLTATFTQSDGTTGALSAGVAPKFVTNPLPSATQCSGSYSSTGGESGTLFLSIESGQVFGTGTTSAGATFPISGALDASGVLYLAYNDGVGYANSVSTASSGSLSSDSAYTLSETPTGQTLNLTLQAAGTAQAQLKQAKGSEAAK